MVELNKAQILALKQLISKVDFDTLALTELPEEGVLLSLSDNDENVTKIALDRWGQGRLVP